MTHFLGPHFLPLSYHHPKLLTKELEVANGISIVIYLFDQEAIHLVLVVVELRQVLYGHVSDKW